MWYEVWSHCLLRNTLLDHLSTLQLLGEITQGYINLISLSLLQQNTIVIEEKCHPCFELRRVIFYNCAITLSEFQLI